MPGELPDVEVFRKEAFLWLEANASLRSAHPTDGEDDEMEWGVGSDNVAVFHNFSEDEERDRLEATRAWQQKKFDAGYAMINWPAELGGRGLPSSYLRAYNTEEAKFVTPSAGELPPTSMGLIATTVAAYGTPEQKQQWIEPLMRMDELACQLFSEPSAGSDLAVAHHPGRARRRRVGAERPEGVDVGARASPTGALAITRTDFDVPKHRGLTAFMVPFSAPGVDVRPIKQMSGGANFNEVFLTDVRLQRRPAARCRSARAGAWR